MIDRARANDAYLRFGQQVAPHYTAFQQFLAQQRGGSAQPPAQSPPQPEQPRNPFGLPEYNPAWLDMVERDGQGNLVPKPGAPLDVAAKLQEYTRAVRAAQERFWQDPTSVLGPVIQQAVQPLLQQHIEQNLQGYQDKQAADAFLQQHTSWLHQRDPQGNVIRDALTGRPMLTREGQMFLNYLVEANQMGVQGQAQQVKYATAMLKSALLPAYFQQQGAAAQGGAAAAGQNAANQQFIQQHNRRPNQGGTLLPNPNPNTVGVSQNASLPLRDRLLQAMQQNGITDQIIAQTAGEH